MKIVIEYVLLENLLINLIILKSTALFLREKGRLFLLSAFLGACLTVALPALRLSALGSVLVQVGLVMVLVCISFKFFSLKKFVQIFATYFVCACLYSGACYFFENMFGITSLIVVLFIVLVMFMLLQFLFKKFHKKVALEKFCYDVEVTAMGNKTKWKAFLDSGNMLFDPLTQSPVSLVDFKVFSAIFEDISLEDVLRRTDKLKSLKFAHYINFGTLNANDKILVFQVDKLDFNGTTLEKPTLGLCLKNFNSAFGTDIILHNNCACVQ